MDELPLGITVTNSKGEYIYANKAMLELYGYSSIEELSSTPEKEIYTPESYTEFLVHRDKRKRGESTNSEYEISIVRKEGEIRHLAVSGREIIWNGTSNFQSIYRDITKNSLLEAELLNAYSEMNAIFSASRDNVLVINGDYTIRRINQEAAHLFGLSINGVVGKKCFDVLGSEHCSYYQTLDCPFLRIAQGEQKVETECNKKSGCASPAGHLLTAYPVIVDGSGIPGLVINLRDVAEANRNRQQMQETNLMASLGEMVAGISHEVNNPLGSILLYSELLLANDIAPSVRKDLKVIHSEAKRAAGVMTKLLTYARSSQPRRRRLNLYNTIQKVLDLRSYQQKVYNIEAVFDKPSGALFVNGDSNQLAQVFMNIFLNAEDAIKAHNGGKINITMRQEGNWARVSIADNGGGIPQENLRRLFHPFFTTKEIGKGTGLGLSVCYGIVVAHGGLIRAENNIMGGATFSIDLPLVQNQFGLEEGVEPVGTVDVST